MAKRVLIADDNKNVRRAIRSILTTKWPDLEVCAETADGRETVATAKLLQPDLLILDVRMPELNGIEVATILKKELPAAKMVLFTMYSDHVGKSLAAAAGVHVILPKVDGLPAFTKAVESLLNGDAYSGKRNTSVSPLRPTSQ
jgi:two-component system nitrate/nitrite response regulator NarL